MTSDVWKDRNGKLPERAVLPSAPAVLVPDDEEEVDAELLLEAVPLAVQEAWICEDLLFVLQVCQTQVFSAADCCSSQSYCRESKAL